MNNNINFKIDFDLYIRICDLLAETDEEGDPRYYLEEIAEIVGETVETIAWVDRSENE